MGVGGDHKKHRGHSSKVKTQLLALRAKGSQINLLLERTEQKASKQTKPHNSQSPSGIQDVAIKFMWALIQSM